MSDDELIARLRNYGHVGTVLEAADRIETLVKERDARPTWQQWKDVVAAGYEQKARADRLEAAVIAAAKIGQIVGFLGEDEGRIEAFREACGPELWAKARAALKGGDHE